MTYPILQPAIVLVLWSLLMLCWAIGLRVPALRKANIDVRVVVGGRGQDLDGVLPDQIQWKAHNYNHLMEQPTLFYAVVLMLAVVAPSDALSVGLAWAYVGTRIVHSVYHATVNVVFVRATMFTVMSFLLIALALRAAVLVF
jgi:hypothetical protein